MSLWLEQSSVIDGLSSSVDCFPGLELGRTLCHGRGGGGICGGGPGHFDMATDVRQAKSSSCRFAGLSILISFLGLTPGSATLRIALLGLFMVEPSLGVAGGGCRNVGRQYGRAVASDVDAISAPESSTSVLSRLGERTRGNRACLRLRTENLQASSGRAPDARPLGASTCACSRQRIGRVRAARGKASSHRCKRPLPLMSLSHAVSKPI